MIKSNNYWHEVIRYVHKKPIYSHIYTSTYNVYNQMLLLKCVLVHIWDENGKLVILPCISTFYAKLIIKGIINMMLVEIIYDIILNAHLCK